MTAARALPSASEGWARCSWWRSSRPPSAASRPLLPAPPPMAATPASHAPTGANPCHWPPPASTPRSRSTGRWPRSCGPIRGPVVSATPQSCWSPVAAPTEQPDRPARKEPLGPKQPDPSCTKGATSAQTRHPAGRGRHRHRPQRHLVRHSQPRHRWRQNHAGGSAYSGTRIGTSCRKLQPRNQAWHRWGVQRLVCMGDL